MKDWKKDVLREMERIAADQKEVQLKQAALAAGVKHIKTAECREILTAFCKEHREYRPLQLLQHNYDSIFESGVATMCEYEEE